MKDFYDVHLLATASVFEGPALTRAILATFARRGTPFPGAEPFALTREFLAVPERQMQWQAFLRRVSLDAPLDTRELTDGLRGFLAPVLAAASRRATLAATWLPGRPWVAAS